MLKVPILTTSSLYNWVIRGIHKAFLKTEVNTMVNTKEVMKHIVIILAVFTATFFLGGMI